MSPYAYNPSTMKGSDYYYTLLDSPLGSIGLICFRGQLSHLFFKETEGALFTKALIQIRAKSGAFPLFDAGPFKKWRDLLNRYFCGEKVLWDEPVLMEGTVFQKTIWGVIARIPYGTVQSYQQVADQWGRGRSARVVGRACAFNPIPIIIPCHRVAPKSGSLGGYRGGQKIKEKLLALEGVNLQSTAMKGWIGGQQNRSNKKEE